MCPMTGTTRQNSTEKVHRVFERFKLDPNVVSLSMVQQPWLRQLKGFYKTFIGCTGMSYRWVEITDIVVNHCMINQENLYGDHVHIFSKTINKNDSLTVKDW